MRGGWRTVPRRVEDPPAPGVLSPIGRCLARDGSRAREERLGLERTCRGDMPDTHRTPWGRSSSAASGPVSMGNAGTSSSVPEPSGDGAAARIGGPDAETRHHDKLPGGRVECPSRRAIANEVIGAAMPPKPRRIWGSPNSRYCAQLFWSVKPQVLTGPKTPDP